MNATQASRSPAVSVVIAVFNSEQSLPLVISSTREVLHSLGLSAEFILVDDGSADGSWSIIQQLAARDGDIRGLRFRRNFGQHNAVLAGIRAASAPITITMDDDLQHPPHEIRRLLDEFNKGFDVVYGFPARLPHSFVRNVLSLSAKIVLQKTMGATTARHVSAFRVLRTDVREAFREYRSAYVSVDVLLTWGTSRFGWILVEHRRREIGRSQYNLLKLVTHALTIITGFSTFPLRMASILGLVFTAVGILLLAFVVGRYLIEGTEVPGFPFLASTIAVFSGAQLFALGVAGEYLARIHMRTLGEPAYVIGETTATEAVGLVERQRHVAGAS